MRPRPLEARLTIDAQQRIVEWDHGAEALLGIGRDEAPLRLCYELVRGRDASGRPVCGPDCPGISSLRQGRLSDSTSMYVENGSGPGRVRCRLTALPAVTGGAVVSLSASIDAQQAPSSHTTGPSDPRPELGAIDRLAALAALTTSLSTGTLEESLERSLEIITATTGADVAELFLSEPGGVGAIRTSHRGSFRRAFGQIVRFERGEGFPGQVLASGEPLLSRRLENDPRYLRHQVKDAGFHAYVCAPLLHHQTVVGSIGLAFRDAPDGEVDRARDFLLWVGGPIGTAVHAALAEESSAASNAGFDALGPDARLEDLTKRMMRASGADAAELRLLHLGSGCFAPAAAGSSTKVNIGVFPAGCRPLEACALEACPAVAQGRSEVLYGRPGTWPAACRSSHGEGGLRLCVPLLSHGTVVGLARLWRRERGNELPGRHVVMIEAMASSTSQLLEEERRRHDAEQRSRELYRWMSEARQLPRSEPTDGQEPVVGTASERALDQPSGHLSVRCFGSFDLRVDGVPLPASAIGRKKALTLLKILLTQHGRPVPQDALIEWLWPHSDPSTKTSQLYVLVHELRRLLEPRKHGDPELVLTDGDRYRIDPAEADHVDVVEFRALAELGVRSHERGDAATAMAACDGAVTLYRGDFMADEPYADWCRQEREQFRETCLELLQRLAALAGTLGDGHRSVRYLRAAVRLDPLREGNHRELMRALWTAGRRDEAVQQYHLCVDLLKQELGVGPLPETSRLLEQIRLSPIP